MNAILLPLILAGHIKHLPADNTSKLCSGPLVRLCYNPDMFNKQKNFRILVLLTIGALICLAAFATWAIHRSSGGQKYIGTSHIWLTGATDENFINYYQLGYELTDLIVGCDDDAEAEVKTKYRDNQLKITLSTNITRHYYYGGPLCEAMPIPYRGSIDIDKNWLFTGKNLEIDFNGQIHKLVVDKEKYIWYLDEDNKMPLFPDKIAVVTVRLSCDKADGIISSYITENNLRLASSLHEGINVINRIPGMEELVLYDNNVQKAYEAKMKEYEKPRTNNSLIEPQSDCTPYISKPILIQNIDFRRSS